MLLAMRSLSCDPAGGAVGAVRGGRPINMRSARERCSFSSICSSRNSLRWNPSGSFCRIVCSMTRGPANPISARLGDVQVAEHREARGDAAGRRIGQDRDVGERGAIEAGERGADLRHLHQRQRALHHPRAAGAGDDDHRHAAGSARSMARVIFSPTTTPMLPPMKPYSIAATTVGIPSMRPVADDHGVFQPWPRCSPRAAPYGLVSVEPADRSTADRRSCSTPVAVEQHLQPLGGPIRKWLAHFGQTLRFVTRSLL